MGTIARGVLALVLLATVAANCRCEDASFAKHVAPILLEQCLVCHNARAPKGRFSVETYAALMKGGESGSAVTPGDGDLSNIVLLLESGEMPKEGDPLPAGQIAVVKTWIADGARLDEGKSEDQPLGAIVPRPVQPAPPEFYPAPLSVTALAFLPSGGLLAVSGYHEVLLFEIGSGRLVRRVQDLPERINSVAFSSDGQWMAVAAGTPGRFGEIRLFRGESGELAADLATAGDSFFDVAFSPDGSKLAAAGADRSVRVWNVADRSEVARIEDHADWVSAVAFSPDGTRLATASRDKTAKVFDLTTLESLVTFSGHEQPVTDVVFSPDGSLVASAGKDGRIRIWDIAEGKQKESERTGGEALTLAISGGGVLCGGAGRKARLLDFEARETKSYGEQPDWIYSLAVSADGMTIAIGSCDGTVTVRQADSGEVIRSFPAMPPEPLVAPRP